MKILVIGGTGTISYGIAQEAIKRGHDVTLLNRGNRSYRLLSDVKYVRADLRDRNAMHLFLSKEYYDIIVDPLAFDIKTIKYNTSLFDGHCAKYVFISSCCAFGNDDKCRETGINEKHPLRPKSMYGKGKLECEKYLAKNKFGFKYVIIRPYITYGDIRIPIPFACRENPYTVIDRIKNDKPLVCFKYTEQNYVTLHNLMYIDDFSRITVSLLESEISDNNDYNVCADRYYTWEEAYNALYNCLGKNKHIYQVEHECYKYLDRHLYQDVMYDKGCAGTVYSSQKARDAINYSKPDVSLAVGMKDVVNYLQSNMSTFEQEEQFNYWTDLLLINAVKDRDEFLTTYINSFSRPSLIMFKLYWHWLHIRYFLSKIPFIRFAWICFKRGIRILIPAR